MQDPESGQIVRESNARLVKWSDDSYSRVLGNEVHMQCECYGAGPNLVQVMDVDKKTIQHSHMHLYASQLADLEGCQV